MKCLNRHKCSYRHSISPRRGVDEDACHHRREYELHSPDERQTSNQPKENDGTAEDHSPNTSEPETGEVISTQLGQIRVFAYDLHTLDRLDLSGRCSDRPEIDVFAGGERRTHHLRTSTAMTNSLSRHLEANRGCNEDNVWNEANDECQRSE